MATEVYHSRRFFFLTGNGSGEPTANQQVIDEICSELTARKASKHPKPKSRQNSTTHMLHLSDTALLEKIRASKQAEKFNQLWDGHIGAYDSPSEADMALTTILMWWCNNEFAQVERLFEQSGACQTREMESGRLSPADTSKSRPIGWIHTEKQKSATIRSLTTLGGTQNA